MADEWKAIGLLLEFSRRRHHNDENDDGEDGCVSNNTTTVGRNTQKNTNTKDRLAMECWDVDDGQVILIQASDHLPDWVDRIGPEHCRHRCWIQNGGVRLIRPDDVSHHSVTEPEYLSLGRALKLLQQQTSGRSNYSSSPLVTVAPESVQRSIQDAVDRVNLPRTNNNNNNNTDYQRAAVALPRSVARLLKVRPDLVSTIVGMFVEHASHGGVVADQEMKDLDRESLAGTGQDWVWTTLSLGRTAYAMLRTVTTAPDWTSEDSVPARMATSLEVKRLKRQCAVEATPHLKHGLQLGVRLVAGIDYCLTTMPPKASESSSLSSLVERRVLLHWSRIARQCSSAQVKNADWMAQAWRAGPVHAVHSLESVLKCPVYDPEVETSLTPLSHPDTVLSEQIRRELLRAVASNDVNEDFATIPRAAEVDDEEWMWMPPSEDDWLPNRDDTSRPSMESPSDAATTRSDQSSVQAAPTTVVLDDMLKGVHSFMTGTSFVEGVATTTEVDTVTTESLQINPTVFLNILHTSLKSKSADELADRLRAAELITDDEVDPFFSKKDYDLMQPDDDTEKDDDRLEKDDDDDDIPMVDLMNAMDDELRLSNSVSRILDGGVKDPSVIGHDAHVLSNLLQSLDAGHGGPGPIKNLLNEMGMRAPDLTSYRNDE